MNCITTFVTQHYVLIGAVVGPWASYIALTLVRHLPPPGTKMTKYEYFYDVLQSLLATPAIQALGSKFGPVNPPAPK